MILLVSSLSTIGFAQSNYDSAYAELALNRPEKLVVFTDRSLYAVNEAIQFSAALESGSRSGPGPGSEVIYAELVNATGEAVAQGKYLLLQNRSSGQLIVPSNIPSGTYLLRAYTRWMRNFGAPAFSYTPLRVVNPFSGEVETASPGSGSLRLEPVEKDPPQVLTRTTRQSYEPGALVDLELSLKEDAISRSLSGCLTVVPAGSIDTSAFLHQVISKQESRELFQFNFLPDKKGTALSGTLTDQNSGEPVPGTRVHFSILGDDPAYLVTTSDQEGRFLLKIPPRLGIQEMFVVPEQASGQRLEVRIENDFSQDDLPFYSGSYELQEEEIRLASRLSLQMQLQLAFLAKSVQDPTRIPKRTETIPFYGRPEISVKMDEFVSLPNMEEVIENLLPATYVIRREGSADFLIKSDNPLISIYPQLILIDYIPVFDAEVVLDIPPSKIERIEVIPEVYVLGEVKYGGILSLTSSQGDLAGMTLPQGSYFFDYASIQPPALPPGPRYPGDGRIPDTRNTLLWKDHLELKKEGPLKISFQAASVPGDYLILFRGLSPDGTAVYGRKLFRVE